MSSHRSGIKPDRRLIRRAGLGLLGLPLILLVAVLMSCSDDGPTAPPDTPPVDTTVTIQDSTVVISPEEAEQVLVAYSEDGEMTVTRAYAEDQGIGIGSVLVSGVNELAPNGLLRMVTAVSDDGEYVLLETEQASLTDAIETGRIRASFELDKENVGTVWVAEGVEYVPDKAELSTEFTFRLDTVLWDEDGDRSTRDDQVRITGEIGLRSALELEVDIDVDWRLRPTLTHMLIASSRKTEVSIEAYMGSTVELGRPLRQKIAEIPGGVITFPAGPVPIVVVMSAEVFLEVGITGTVSVQFGYSMEETTRSGSVYRNGAWTDFDETDKTVYPLDVSIRGSVEAKAAVVSRASMTVYGVAGPYVAGEVYAAASASAELGSQGVELDVEVACGLDVSLGFLVRVFSRDLVDIASTWELWRLVIYEHSHRLNSYPDACFSVTPTVGTPATLFEVDAWCSSDEEDETAELEVRWDWDDDGVWDTQWTTTKTASHQYNTPGVKTIRLEVRDTGGLTAETTRDVTVEEAPPSNTPPTACFSVTPSGGDTTTNFQVDASCSSDAEDPTAALEVRWDWNDDGVWDTQWTTTKTASHRYNTAGVKTIRLEVRDTGGLTAETTRNVTVSEDSPTPPGFVRIPAGTFTMGSPAHEGGRFQDEVQRQVTLTRDFFMGIYEVTQAEWVAVMGWNPSYNIGDNLPVERVTWFDCIDFCIRKSQAGGLSPAYTLADVVRSGNHITSATVSWDENANGYRLPTEAEWEYACRAGTTHPFNNGSYCLSSDDEANFCGVETPPGCPSGACRAMSTPVGTFEPNGWGLHDMHGNVFELCWDWYEFPSSRPVEDPTGPESGDWRVARGGSFFGLMSFCRSAQRYFQSPDSRIGMDTGFRLARTAQ